MASINRALGALVETGLSPFATLPPLVGLTAVALAVALFALLMFRLTSNQPALAAVKRQIRAGIFEMRLFNDDVRALQGAAGVLRHNLTYLRLSLVPMAWLIVPLGLLTVHLHFYYGYEGFAPGQSTVLKVHLAERAIADGAAPAITVTAPAGVRVETPRVWIPETREAAWRLAFERRGDYELVVTVGDVRVTKQVSVSNRLGRRSPARFEAALFTQVLYPAEAPIDPDAAVEAVELAYPERQINLLGFSVQWAVAFFILSFLFAWALSARVGVIF